MDTPTPTRPTYTEAPASWNCRYVSPDGFECQLTLRGESGADLLPRTVAALEWLSQKGCTPKGFKAAVAAVEAAIDAHPAPANGEAYCREHGCEMKRHEKNGQVWYSHKHGDGWCRGSQP
jgi:hypothetical protein